MSSFGTIVAPAASVAAQSSAPASPRADAANGQNPAQLATALANGQAAVVSLSASSEKRAPSQRPNSKVDAAFEKQKSVGGKEKKSGGKGKVSVTA